MNFSPVYKSTTGDVEAMDYAPNIGGLLVSSGMRMTRISEFPPDAYNRGLTSVYAQIEDGNGDISSILRTPIYYDLYHAVSLLSTEDDTFTVVKENVAAYSAYHYAKVRGIYISEVLKADEDFGFWKTVAWHQTAETSRVVVAIKTATTQAGLADQEWWYLYEAPTTVYSQTQSELDVSKSLDRFNISGRYMQFKVELETSSSSDVPAVTDFVITYAGKYSVYFFTKKIRIGTPEGQRNLLLTASTTTPSKTEVRFGITDSNSADWEDYTIITRDKITQLAETFGPKLKIGIKFTSYDTVQAAVVEEFAFLVDGEGVPLEVDEN